MRSWVVEKGTHQNIEISFNKSNLNSCKHLENTLRSLTQVLLGLTQPIIFRIKLR